LKTWDGHFSGYARTSDMLFLLALLLVTPPNLTILAPAGAARH
jgi:hypothetical protein